MEKLTHLKESFHSNKSDTVMFVEYIFQFLSEYPHLLSKQNLLRNLAVNIGS